MASPTNVRHELANALIECDGTADDTVRQLVDQLVVAEKEWGSDLRNRQDDRSFLQWLAEQ